MEGLGRTPSSGSGTGERERAPEANRGDLSEDLLVSSQGMTEPRHEFPGVALVGFSHAACPSPTGAGQ
jgi:hypothetical protein